jgi:microcystin-dependent protein
MSTPYLCELRIFSFNFAPRGWAQCNGQVMAISQNQALFSLLGTTYGGNGTTNFGLPNLQGKTPIFYGNGFVQGQQGGETAHTLLLSEIPIHSHSLVASSNSQNANTPANNFLASNTGNIPYSNTAQSGVMGTAALANTGGSQAHENMPPYLVVNICIALQGIFPSRN